MAKIKLEKNSQIQIVSHNIEKQSIILIEPHIGEMTFVSSLYNQIVKLVRDKKAVLHIAGDLLNADDLRKNGVMSNSFIINDIDEFEKKFIKSLPKNTVKVLLQQNHGTRMYNKDIARQLGFNITERWENKVVKPLLKDGTIVLDEEDTMYELHLTDNSKKVIAKGIVVHPVGLSSPNAYLNRIKELFGSGYDFIIAFHFHKSFGAEVVSQIPNNYIDFKEFKCVPPLIENPMYGRGKYSPIHAGFLVIYYGEDYIGRPKIKYEVIQK